MITALEKFKKLPEAMKVPEMVFKFDAIGREIAELMEMQQQVKQSMIKVLLENWSSKDLKDAGFLHDQ